MYNMISTRQLTPKGDRAIRDLAQHYGVSVEAVRTLLSQSQPVAAHWLSLTILNWAAAASG